MSKKKVINEIETHLYRYEITFDKKKNQFNTDMFIKVIRNNKFQDTKKFVLHDSRFTPLHTFGNTKVESVVHYVLSAFQEIYNLNYTVSGGYVIPLRSRETRLKNFFNYELVVGNEVEKREPPPPPEPPSLSKRPEPRIEYDGVWPFNRRPNASRNSNNLFFITLQPKGPIKHDND